MGTDGAQRKYPKRTPEPEPTLGPAGTGRTGGIRLGFQARAGLRLESDSRQAEKLGGAGDPDLDSGKGGEV